MLAMDSLGGGDEGRILDKAAGGSGHDLGGIDHTFVGGRRLTLRHSLPRVEGRSDGTGRDAGLYSGHRPAHIAHIG